MTDEPQITKKRVTMTSIVAVPKDEHFPEGFAKHEAIDFVRPDFLDEYVANARTRWQSVEVSEEPDAGPAGYYGATHVPADLAHPLAGQTFAATSPEEK